MKAHIWPIVKQIWLLPFMYCLYNFGISYTQQLTIGIDSLWSSCLYHWADTSLHLPLAIALSAPFLWLLNLTKNYVQSVWPDWATFETSRGDKFPYKSSPNIFWLYWLFWKSHWLLISRDRIENSVSCVVF